MTKQFKTVQEVRTHVEKYNRCSPMTKDALFMYLEGVEDQLESDDFLPGQDVTWNAAVSLFIDVVRTQHYDQIK